MLVVRGRKSTDPPPPFHEMQGLGTQIKKLWKDIGKVHRWEHLRVPLGQVAVEGEVHRGGLRLFEDDQGRAH